MEKLLFFYYLKSQELELFSTNIGNLFGLISGEIRLAQPLYELSPRSHTGQPILLKVVAEEIRTNLEEAPSQSTVIQVALLPPGPISNKSTVFGVTEYITLLDENSAPGTVLELAQANIIVEPGDSLTLELQNNNGRSERTIYYPSD